MNRIQPALSAGLAAALAAVLAGPAAGGGLECAAREMTFQHAEGSPYRVGPMAGRPVLADMNGDGRIDIVVACGTCCGLPASAESGHVMVLLGQDGRFARVAGMPVKIAPSARKIAAGDLNGDGYTDIAVAEHDSYRVTILLGDGSGALSPAAGPPLVASNGSSPHTHELALADLNGDRAPDVITTNANDGTISVMLNDGRGRFEPGAGSPFAAGRHPYDVIAAGDVNADGAADVVVPLLAGAKVGVMFGDGRGGLASAEADRYAVEPRPGCVAMGDLNGDARPDLAVTHDDSAAIRLLFNDGHGRFRNGPTVTAPGHLWSVAITDMSRDGRNDLVLGSLGGSKATVLLGDGKGTFPATPVTVETGGRGSNYAVGADLNADGRPDLLTGNYDSGDVSVLLAAWKLGEVTDDE